MPTLVIVDMQPGFPASQHKRLMNNVIKQVLEAKKKRWGILVVEFRGAGKTNELIIDAIGRYGKYALTTKGSCDGSVEIVRVCNRRRFSTRSFYVCGVYTRECVKETCVGLASKSFAPDVFVLKGCCRNSYTKADTNWHTSWIRDYPDLKRNLKRK